MKKLLLSGLILCAFLSQTIAQEFQTYQEPPQSIKELVDFERAPAVLLDNKKEIMVEVFRPTYKSLTDLMSKELKLAGLRIDPDKNISTTTTYYNNIAVTDIKKGNTKWVKGLPESPRLTYFSWSNDERFLAFTHTTENEGVLIYVLDVRTGVAKPITSAKVNANLGTPYTWHPDGNRILVRMTRDENTHVAGLEKQVPQGPTVTLSEGSISQNRTYQDLLKNKTDEDNFQKLTHTDLYWYDLNGNATLFMENKMFMNESFSPDGQYVLIETLQTPFSYIVPYSRFPKVSAIYNLDAQLVQSLATKPLVEDMPKGFMATYEGPRSYSWRPDMAATLYWVEAQDKGDPAVEVSHRDKLYQWKAPFKEEVQEIFATQQRFAGIHWGTSDFALVEDYWWDTRNTKMYVINPSQTNQIADPIVDRNYQDKYNDPGSLIKERNEYGRSVLRMKGDVVYLNGAGFTPKGQFPFVDAWDVKKDTKKRIYESKLKNQKENIIDFLDDKTNQLIVRVESSQDYPNYYIRNVRNAKVTKQLTHFKNPFTSIQNVRKEILRYEREDGVVLSGTLYYPLDYEEGKKYPMIMWAYPAEFKDAQSAGQVTTNPNEFIFPFYGSPIYWVTQGYVVLDDASFPIVGEGDEEPNDTFIEQLVANAKAAIDAVDAKGLVDRNRVAVGGHSYGAFMTANLLSHSDLFAAGIARSGAYNRTLTPFGFQAEQRNYWEAPEVYNAMSPFMHADKMKTPMLLIHGEVDNNSGTYTMQSERYFNALKGFGAPARLVILPLESHGYSAKESIMHVLWEQHEWLETHVKNKQ
ncbi:MAG TPA: prolyl oligopeptidase family serine peptidase [Chitinophagaceae bacterium]|nr:prolyl oligopeptidase family serine peptidase [Chitinophagaceae bacterium]